MPELRELSNQQATSGADKLVELLQQRSQKQALQTALKSYNVPNATAKKIIEQQEQQQQQQQPQQTQLQIFTGYVGNVFTLPAEGTYVTVYGKSLYTSDFQASFWFPPNDPKFLAELLRAMNYPHLMVGLRYTQEPGKVAMLNDLGVGTDYSNVLQPNFDERKITNTVQIQGHTW